LGGFVALFVLVLVGVVVAQTWFDWRDTKKARVVPEWAKGMALGGLLSVPLAAAAAVFSIWLRQDTGQLSDVFSSRTFWPELLFVLAAMGVLVIAVRKKGLRFMLLLAGVVIVAFWLGLTL
jgi:hypothetical protein